ncbi:hypothetical protein [Leptodesmis sp.]|uniref:hypothetical protein n=1 Tax=Leptodesmis sp. TaxID=3100501 RepID=UPI004053488B
MGTAKEPPHPRLDRDTSSEWAQASTQERLLDHHFCGIPADRLIDDRPTAVA